MSANSKRSSLSQRIARFLVLWLLIAGFVKATPVWAQTPPLPLKKKIERTASETRAQAASEKKADLEEALKQQDDELKATKKKLVSTADAVQKSEKRLLEFEQKITHLKAEQEQAENEILNDQHAIADLVLALSRLQRTPPEAIIIKPDAPLKTAQSAMLMQDILPVLQARAAALKSNLETLKQTADRLQNQHEQARIEAEKLKSEQDKLTGLVEKRSALYASTHQDYKEQGQKAEKIATQSKNLSELVEKLAAQRRIDTHTRSDTNQKTSSVQKIPQLGGARMPIAGAITTHFNQPDNFGAPSQGIDIEGRAGSVVVAPMGGIIRFSGFFKNYGNMVIIEHEKGWHSLIAGFEKIDTVVNQSVSAGEPLGRLHRSSTGGKPVLYYELRHHGKTVNPAQKVANLG